MTDVSELVARLRSHTPPKIKDLDEAADALEAMAREISDCKRLREDERLTWDAQHKRQASVNAHLAALVTDAQEELRKCQQDAIALQERLASAERLAEAEAAVSEELETRLAEAERDAARYRWLRKKVGGEEMERLTGRWPMSNGEFDGLIDATMEGGE